MPKQAKKFEFDLTPKEAAEIHVPRGQGGRQQLELQIYRQLQANPGKVAFDDRGLGKLLRYMSQYDGTDGGGLQARLHRAFARSLREKLSL